MSFAFLCFFWWFHYLQWLPRAVLKCWSTFLNVGRLWSVFGEKYMRQNTLLRQELLEALFRPLYMEQFLKGKRNSQWGSVMVNYGSTWLDHGVFRYLVKHSSVSRGYFWMKLTPEGWVKQIALPSGGGPHPNPLKAQTAWQAAVRGVAKRWVQLSMRTYTESKAE